jgi:hypothetical protein
MEKYDDCVTEHQSNQPVLAFQLRSKELKTINIYSDGHVDGEGAEEYCCIANYFTPRFDIIRGISAQMRLGKIYTEDELDLAFAGY